jgi:ribulose 1,5-bisphosphate carboxylase large subunit-like protein
MGESMSNDTSGERESHPYHRRFVRHKVRLKIDIKTGESFNSWTNNLSEDGVCFEIPRRLAKESEIGVWIYVSRAKGPPPVESRCRVVWQDGGKKGYRHGGQFIAFAEGDIERLQRFLAEISRPITQPPPP